MEKESLAAEIGELSSELAKYKGENFDYKVYTIFVKFSNTFVYNMYMYCFTCLYTNLHLFIPPPPITKKNDNSNFLSRFLFCPLGPSWAQPSTIITIGQMSLNQFIDKGSSS